MKNRIEEYIHKMAHKSEPLSKKEMAEVMDVVNDSITYRQHPCGLLCSINYLVLNARLKEKFDLDFRIVEGEEVEEVFISGHTGAVLGNEYGFLYSAVERAL